MCECGSTVFTMMKYSPEARRLKANSKRRLAQIRDTGLASGSRLASGVRMASGVRQPIASAEGPAAEEEGPASAAAEELQKRAQEDEQMRQQIAIKIANEEWAESLLVFVTPPLALALVQFGSVSVTFNPSIYEMGIRMLCLFALEIVSNTIKQRICHRFKIYVSYVQIEIDAVGIATCLMVFLVTASALCVGLVLDGYV